MINYQSAVNSHLTPKIYVVQAISNSVDEPALIRINQDKVFNNFNLTNFNSINSNTQAKNDDHVITKAYIDQFPQVFERNRRGLSIDFYNESSDKVRNIQDNDFNANKLTNFDSITVITNPNSNIALSNKKNYNDQ